MAELQIYTNYYSTVAQKNLSIAGDSMSKAVGRLSSGVRINTAGDDAAGIAMADKLREQVQGLQKASLNAQDAVSLLQTAEGGMEAIGDMLQRMRELAVQAGNGIYTSTDRQELQKEFDQLKTEIDRIAVATEYNSKKLLNGNASGYWSSTSDDVEAIFNGVPAEGNYKLTLTTETGQNAVYKSSKFMDEFFQTHEMILPDGIKNVEVEGIDPNLIEWTISDDIVSIPHVGRDSAQIWQYDTPTIMYYSDTPAGDLSSVVFTGAEDYRGASNYLYPYDSFSGFYIGIERVAYEGQPLIASGDGTYFTYTDDDGNIARAFQSTHDDPSVYISTFFVDPATGTKQYAIRLVSNGYARNLNYAYIEGVPILAPGKKFEVQFTADKFEQNSEVGDKILWFHQANTPATPTTTDPNVHANNKFPGNTGVTYKNVQIKIAVPSGTETTNGNFEVNVFWDIDNPGRTQFKAMTIINGEFKEVKISWDRDWDVAPEDINGTYYVPPTTIFTPDQIKLQDMPTFNEIPAFTNAEGRMILDNTQTLTVYGNGRQAEISLEGNDTLQDLLDKLGDALSVGLQMGADGVLPQELVKIITAGTTARNGIVAIPGTIIMQGALTGKASEIRFAGSEAVLNALGFSQLQAASESLATLTVTEAHTGKFIGKQTTSDGVIRNVISGVDVKYNAHSGISARYDSNTGKVMFDATEDKEAYLHVVKNVTSMQVGANEGQLYDISVARLDSYSLEIDDAYIMNMVDSQKAITKLDQAFEKITHARALIGAQIERMEYTIKNISVGSENLIAAESKIRDLDVAEESADFARKQVLTNAAMAVLVQANQLPQTALQLIGR